MFELHHFSCCQISINVGKGRRVGKQGQVILGCFTNKSQTFLSLDGQTLSSSQIASNCMIKSVAQGQYVVSDTPCPALHGCKSE